MVQSDITTQETTQSVVDKLNNAETVKLQAGTYDFTLSKTKKGNVNILYSPNGFPDRTQGKIVKMEEFKIVPDLKTYLNSDKVLEGGAKKRRTKKSKKSKRVRRRRTNKTRK